MCFARAVPLANGAQNTSQSIADLIADALDSATCVPYSLAFQLLTLLCDLYSRTHQVRSQRDARPRTVRTRSRYRQMGHGCAVNP